MSNEWYNQVHNLVVKAQVGKLVYEDIVYYRENRLVVPRYLRAIETLNRYPEFNQIVEKGNTALIVPVTNNFEVVFVKEFFVAINQYSLTVPKGRIDEGHNPI